MASHKLKAAILVVSQTAARDPSTDKCIDTLQSVFRDDGADKWDIPKSKIVPDNVLEIQRAVTGWSDGSEPVNLIITSGGTGFAVNDHTPEVRQRQALFEVNAEIVVRLLLLCYINTLQDLCTHLLRSINNGQSR